MAWADLAAYDVVSVAQSSGNRLLVDQALAGLGIIGRTQPDIGSKHPIQRAHLLRVEADDMRQHDADGQSVRDGW